MGQLFFTQLQDVYYQENGNRSFYVSDREISAFTSVLPSKNKEEQIKGRQRESDRGLEEGNK